MILKNDGDFELPVERAQLLQAFTGYKFYRVDIPERYIKIKNGLMIIGKNMDIPEADIVEEDG